MKVSNDIYLGGKWLQKTAMTMSPPIGGSESHLVRSAQHDSDARPLM